MRLFDPRDRKIPPELARRYAMFEVLHTLVDFLAALLFIIGSVLFFSEQTKVAGTFCFLFGSVCFAAKPSIRLMREVWLGRMRDVDQLAEMAPEGPDSIQEVTDDGDGGTRRSEVTGGDEGR